MPGNIQRPTLERFSKELHELLIRYCVEPPLEDKLSMAEFIGTLVLEAHSALHFLYACIEKQHRDE